MNAIEISKVIWELRDINWAEFSLEEQTVLNEKFEKAIKLLEEEIENTDITDLDYIKEKDKESFSMPVQVMFKVYQNIIQIDYNISENLKGFSNYLSFYGPDWEEEVRDILNFLEQDKIEEAKEIAMKVDYHKYN